MWMNFKYFFFHLIIYSNLLFTTGGSVCFNDNKRSLQTNKKSDQRDFNVSTTQKILISIKFLIYKICALTDA